MSQSWRLSLAAAPDGWSEWRPAPTELAPGHEYSLVAWRELNVANALGVDFHAEDVNGLRSDRILVRSYDAQGGEPRLVRVALGEFKRMACE